MFTDILWRFLILETFVLGALCLTSCPYKHPQKWFCSNDFVLTMRVQDVINVTKGHRYKMEILKVFRGDREQLAITDHRYVYFEAEHILGEKTYLVYAQNKDGLLYSGTCPFTIPWDYLTEYQIDSTTKRYNTGCDCIDVIDDYWDYCELYYSYVEMVDDKLCNWVQTPELEDCRSLFNPDDK